MSEDQGMYFEEAIPLLRYGKLIHSKILMIGHYLKADGEHLRWFDKISHKPSRDFVGSICVLLNGWHEYEYENQKITHRQAFIELLDGKTLYDKTSLGIHSWSLSENGFLVNEEGTEASMCFYNKKCELENKEDED